MPKTTAVIAPTQPGASKSGKTRTRPAARGPFWPTLSRRITVAPRAGHNAIDIGGSLGDPIFAPVAGIITAIRNDPSGYGLNIRELTNDGRELIFAHLSGAGVRVGQNVTAGQTIGALGSTGRSTGPHLHFEVRRPGPEAFAGLSTTSALDPYSLLGLAPSNAPGGSSVRLLSGSPGYRTTAQMQATANGDQTAGRTWIQQAAAAAGRAEVKKTPEGVLVINTPLGPIYPEIPLVRLVTFWLGVVLVLIALWRISGPRLSKIAGAAIGEIPGADTVKAAVA